jgi:hypothetical protein
MRFVQLSDDLSVDEQDVLIVPSAPTHAAATGKVGSTSNPGVTGV